MSKDKDELILEFKEAFLKPAPSDSTTRKLTRQIEKAGRSGNAAEFRKIAEQLAQHDPKYYASLTVYKLQKHKGKANESKFAAWSNNISPLEGVGSEIIREVFTKGWRGPILSSRLNIEDARQMAAIDAKGFVTTVLQESSPGLNAMFQFIADPELRNLLAADEQARTILNDSIPMFKYLNKVKENVSSRSPSMIELPKVTAEEVFKELLSEDSCFQVTYFPGTLTRLKEALVFPEKAKQGLQERRETAPEETLETLPEIMAAQCDELVTLLKNLIEASLGPEYEGICKQVPLEGMVLTVPVNTLPGGLLKNSFGGNVYQDVGGLNGQVFFSGSDGLKSHTYLEVDGIAYDAVFGTTGNGVLESKDDTFLSWDDWTEDDGAGTTKPIKVAVSEKKKFLICETDRKAAPNKNGFVEAYRLVDPEKIDEPKKVFFPKGRP